jgi:hypothetical protein
MEPYRHPEGSPVTSYAGDPLAQDPARADPILGASP